MRPALEQLMNKHRLIGAEIGVFQGIYASVYLKALDIKKVFLIDPYIKYENYDRYESKVLRDAEKAAHERLSIYANKIIWMKIKSEEAAKSIDFESLDFVYIDGNHEHQAVLQDITLYYPKVKKDRLMSGHDYRPNIRNNVSDAIREFCEKHSLKLHIDIQTTDWWFWK